MAKEESNPPEHTIRVGDLELALWRRDGEFGPMYSGKLQRRYTGYTAGIPSGPGIPNTPAARIKNEIAKAVRTYAYRRQLAATLPELESLLNACFDYLHTDTLTGYQWRVRRSNGNLEFERLAQEDSRQLYLPTFEYLAQALEESKTKGI